MALKIKKILAIILVPILIIGSFYPGIVGNVILYVTNGKSIDVNGYRIIFPLSHWALFREDKYSYVFSGRKVYNHPLKIETLKAPHNLNVDFLKQNCKEVKKSFVDIRGRGYTCRYGKNKSMFYFISNDKKLILNSGDDFDPTNEEELKEYDKLFNNIVHLEP